ncbi:hypothetical protein ACKWTF_012148 [Chironomus riparius]
MLLKIGFPSIRSIKLHHDDPEVFLKSQWQKSAKSWIFLTYRWTICAFFMFVLAYSLLQDPTTIAYFFIYLTNIGILLVTLFTLYAAIISTLYHFDIIKIEAASLSYKLFWVVSNMSIVLAFMITIVYWSALYDWNSGTLTLHDFLIHSSNSIFMFIEICVVSHPIHLLHFIYPIAGGLCYLVFSLVYFYSGGTDAIGRDYIYSILNWNYPGQTTIVCIFVAVLIILLQCFATLCQLTRTKFYNFLTEKEYSFTRP